MMSSKLSAKQILRHFYKSGADGVSTKKFQDFEMAEQKSILADLEGFSDKDPILVSRPNIASWSAILSDRIVFGTPQGSHEILFHDIQSVEPADEKEHLTSGNSVSYLKVSKGFGVPLLVPVEAGPPAFGLWKVLVFV